MELETDKAVVEVPSSVSGVVKDVRVKEGEKIKVGQVIFTVDNGSGGVRAASPAKPAAPAPAVSPSAPKTASPARKSQAPSPGSHAVVPSETAEITEFRLPELGENIDQGDLVRLMVSAGATLSEGQPVMELETDKAVVEVPSSVSGVVKDVLVKQGEKIKVGQVIFTLEAGATSQAHAQQPSRADESIRKVRPNKKPCLRTSQIPLWWLVSACRWIWIGLPARNIAGRFRQLRTCGDWRGSWEWISITWREAAPADASAKMTSKPLRKLCWRRAQERPHPLI
jgi:pyruvate dehydrogenase E2 component (dihydrolipoamide acetyltransferase)